MTVALAGMTLHTDNDNESGWGGTDGPDDYNNAEQGSNSESWQVSKNSSEAGTLTKSSTLPTTRGIFTFWMSSNLAPYYTEIELQLESTTNNFKVFTTATSSNKAIGGNFVASAIDYVNKGTETGTFAPASFSKTVITVDNSSSGNIRSVINNWIDAMYYGPGHTVSGTTTGDKLFAEAAAIDELTANKYGVIWNYNGIIYSQGDLDLSGTALVSDSETLVFVDTLNGYDTYNLDISGTVTFANSAFIAAGTIDFNLDASGATAFSMTGGSVTGALYMDFADGQTVSGVVFNSIGSCAIANDPDGCTWNTSGLITVATAGSLDGCILNEGSGSVAVSIATLSRLTDNSFISDGTGHGVDLGTISSTQSMSWDNSDTGYTASSSGNETIVVSVNSGIILTINVAAGASTPSVYNTGTGTVNVVSGLVDFSFSVQDENGTAITGYEWRLYDDEAVSGEYGTELDGEEVATSSSQTYSYTYTSDDSFFLQVMKDGYVENKTRGLLVSSDQNLNIIMKTENN